MDLLKEAAVEEKKYVLTPIDLVGQEAVADYFY